MIFGLRPIIEAIEAGKQLEKVYLKKGADGVLLNELAELCRSKRIHVQWVPIEKLNYLTRNGNHQGAVALTAAIEYVDVYDMLAGIPEDETPLVEETRTLFAESYPATEGTTYTIEKQR